MIYPLPAVLISCGDNPSNYNMFTVSWVGTTCTNPAMCYISVRPERHSYPIIKESGEFVINLTTADMARATDWCGVRSGKDFDKAKETGLTYGPSKEVKAPIIMESPLSIECKVKQIIPLGSHDMFLAELANKFSGVEIFAMCIYKGISIGKVPFARFGVQVSVVGLYVDNFGKEHIV